MSQGKVQSLNWTGKADNRERDASERHSEQVMALLIKQIQKKANNRSVFQAEFNSDVTDTQTRGGGKGQGKEDC